MYLLEGENERTQAWGVRKEQREKEKQPHLLSRKPGSGRGARFQDLEIMT